MSYGGNIMVSPSDFVGGETVAGLPLASRENAIRIVKLGSTLIGSVALGVYVGLVDTLNAIGTFFERLFGGVATFVAQYISLSVGGAAGTTGMAWRQATAWYTGTPLDVVLAVSIVGATVLTFYGVIRSVV